MKTMNQMDLFKQPVNDALARKLRDEGMQRAIDHADRVIDRWQDKAYESLRVYISFNSQPFLSEDVRVYAAHLGIPDPPDKRAWGAVMMRAAKAGLIRKLGWTTASDPKVHKNPVSQWIRA